MSVDSRVIGSKDSGIIKFVTAYEGDVSGSEYGSKPVVTFNDDFNRCLLLFNKLNKNPLLGKVGGKLIVIAYLKEYDGKTLVAPRVKLFNNNSKVTDEYKKLIKLLDNEEEIDKATDNYVKLNSTEFRQTTKILTFNS